MELNCLDLQNDKVSPFFFLLWPRVDELLAEELCGGFKGAKELRKTRCDGEETN